MSRHPDAMTAQQRRERRWARLKILAAANRRRRSDVLKPFSQRTIQQAVCVARRRGLVSDDCLVTAGYNPRSPKDAERPAASTPPGGGRGAGEAAA